MIKEIKTMLQLLRRYMEIDKNNRETWETVAPRVYKINVFTRVACWELKVETGDTRTSFSFYGAGDTYLGGFHTLNSELDDEPELLNELNDFVSLIVKESYESLESTAGTIKDFNALLKKNLEDLE